MNEPAAPSRSLAGFRIAVLAPCYNEAIAIAKVVKDFRAVLPAARIYVYDNNSTDATAETAARAGATVRREPLQGKGNVVRRMFSDIDADIYVLVDGDATYDAPSAPAMIDRLLDDRLDMVVGSRIDVEVEAYRPGHRWGNRALTGFVGMLFGERFSDILSGYRVLSRRYVKSFPALATGFEIETELTVHALELRMPVAEMATPYHSRPPGSASKLSTLRDGWRIGWTIVSLFKDERPLVFFSLAFAVLALLSFAIATPVILAYVETGLVERLPTAVLATGIMLLAFLSLACGFILDTVTHGRREIKRLAYLTVPALDR